MVASKTLRAGAGLALIFSFSACAAPNHRAEHRPSLTQRPTASYDNDIKVSEEIEAIPVYYGEPEPHGFRFEREAGLLVAEEGTGHEVVTRLQLVFPTMENPAKLFGFIKYRPEQRWRKGYCYWQVPLWWVTLGLWKLVPLSYPCDHALWHTGGLREIGGKERREELLELGLKIEAHRVGGDAVVMANVADQAANGWVVKLAK